MRIITAGVLFLCVVTIAASQNAGELRVAGPGKQLPEEILDRAVRDANNEICAGLVILSDIDRLSYDANNGVVRMLHSPGRDVLFLQADERVVTILKSGYKPLRIVLGDAGIALHSGEVWQLTVTGDRSRERVPVRIVVRPEGAQLTVDDTVCVAGRQQELTVGTHLLRLEKGGYETLDTAIAVDPATNVISFRLRKLELQPVWISSIPRGAFIVINDSVYGRTDKDVPLYPGHYRLSIASPGFDTSSREIVVLAGARNEFPFTLGRNRGTLVVRVSPGDALVTVDGVERQADSRIDLNAGQHRLAVEKTGFHPEGDFVDIIRARRWRKRSS